MRTKSSFDSPAPPRQGLIRAAREACALADMRLAAADGAAFLPAGTRVRHAVFGAGTVLGADEDKSAHIVQFDTMPTPRSIALRARLERI